MTTDRELMQQALDALANFDLDVRLKVVPALRARLAQPEPEELGEIVPANEEQLKRIAKLVEPEPVATLFGSLPVYDVPPAKPVAWVENLENARPHCVTDLKYCSVMQHERSEHLKYIPLYTAPPQREWQGLTDEDRQEIERWIEFKEAGGNEPVPAQKIVTYVEAKLREKNNAV